MMTTDVPKADSGSTQAIDFMDYLGKEHANFILSMSYLHQEFVAFSHVDHLFRAAIPAEARVPEHRAVPMHLLTVATELVAHRFISWLAFPVNHASCLRSAAVT